MIQQDGKTIGEVFAEATACWPDAAFLITPAPNGGVPAIWTYAETARAVTKYAATLTAAGYGHGHRIALLMGNEAEFLILKLAFAEIGASCVPVNPDYRAAEVAYLLDDSAADLAIAADSRAGLMQDGIAEAGNKPPFTTFSDLSDPPPARRAPPITGRVTPDTEGSLIYTSGTTGRPKGCMIGHEAELMYGASYHLIPEPISLREAGDRVLNPLPLFHVNAGIITFFGVLMAGCALVIPQRFSVSTWWRDVRDTETTVFHYLGVVISVLMADKTATKADIGKLRVALGAGVEPALHAPFEERFGVPLIECWGMSEMCRVLFVAEEPRMINTRAIGRPRADLECKIVDQSDAEVTRGTPGELCIRHSAATPRKGFFSGYLNKPEATADAWRDGWFHTGDTMMMDETDMIFFIDRAKNIIRRAGENIAAAEVENCLFEDPRVTAVACIAATDDIREEEVLACIVLAEGTPATEATARTLFDHAFARMAYFKPPGWIRFLDALPVTSTQKVVKHKIFSEGEDPREGAFDFRQLKRRS